MISGHIEVISPYGQAACFEVRFDTKVEDGPLGEGGERYYNYVRLVRN